jgi:hypothetical protein
MFLEFSLSLRYIGIVFAPRLKWHNRNRFLKNLCPLTLPTSSLRAPCVLTMFHFEVTLGQVEGTMWAPSTLSLPAKQREVLDPFALETSGAGTCHWVNKAKPIPRQYFYSLR